MASLLYTQPLIKSEFPHEWEGHGGHAFSSCHDTSFSCSYIPVVDCIHRIADFQRISERSSLINN